MSTNSGSVWALVAIASLPPFRIYPWKCPSDSLLYRIYIIVNTTHEINTCNIISFSKEGKCGHSYSPRPLWMEVIVRCLQRRQLMVASVWHRQRDDDTTAKTNKKRRVYCATSVHSVRYTRSSSVNFLAKQSSDSDDIIHCRNDDNCCCFWYKMGHRKRHLEGTIAAAPAEEVYMSRLGFLGST